MGDLAYPSAPANKRHSGRRSCGQKVRCCIVSLTYARQGRRSGSVRDNGRPSKWLVPIGTFAGMDDRSQMRHYLTKALSVEGVACLGTRRIT